MIIQAKCPHCLEAVVFRANEILEFDILPNEKLGLELSDEQTISLPCPNCKKESEFCLIIEQDEHYEID